MLSLLYICFHSLSRWIPLQDFSVLEQQNKYFQMKCFHMMESTISWRGIMRSTSIWDGNGSCTLTLLMGTGVET